MADDVERLAKVLELAKEHRLVVGAVVVGDIKLAITGRAVERPMATHDSSQVDVVKDAATQRDEKLKVLRKKSELQFGRPLEDDVLLYFESLL